MSFPRPNGLTAAWLALVLITGISVYAAEFTPWRLVAVGAIMTIAAIKGLIILWGFMDAAAAPAGIRGYMIGWVIACAIMILAAYAIPIHLT
jgi:hypothetical protein